MALMLPDRTAVPGYLDSRLFQPRSVVLIATPDSANAAILARNLAAGRFHGRLFAVGAGAPYAPEGFEPFVTLESLPEAPDLAILCVPPEALAETLAAMAARGCFAAIVPGSAPGLAAMAEQHGIRAIGHGSFGLAVPAIGLNATLSHIPPRAGRLALVTQSGAVARAVLDWAEAQRLGFSHVVGLGGNAHFGFAATLDWLARDAGTSAILLDIRRIRNRRMMLSAARAATQLRPVVAMRAGGLLADPSGRSNAVMSAALRRSGVLPVGGLEALLSAAETLARARPKPLAPDSKPGGIALLANGLGMARLAADAVLAGGGKLAVLPEETRAQLSQWLPAGLVADNPVALLPDAGPHLAEAATLLAKLPEVESVVVLHAPAPNENAAATADSLAAAARDRRGAPILVGWTGEATAGLQRAALASSGLAVFATPEAAIRGALYLRQHRRAQAAAAQLPPREVLDLQPDRVAVQRIFATARADGRLALTEDEGLRVLAAYHMPVVAGRIAATPAEAGLAAMQIGFPCVLKLRSPDIPRKSEFGAVVLGLRSVAQVRESATAMLQRVKQAQPGARLLGFLVQRQVPRALELRLRLDEDPMFGPWISFGQGGTAADMARDEKFELPPLNRPLAEALVTRTRVGPLLAGWRDQPAVPRGAVPDALVRLSQLAVDFPEIARLAINPLLAGPEGVQAVDCALTLRPAGERGVLAIAPYPAELAEDWISAEGNQLTIRPIRPEDAAAHADFFRNLSPDDVRWRFFSALRSLSAERIARLTNIDYDREMAFVATHMREDGVAEIVGVARLIRMNNGPEGEFAVVVRPTMKGQGLGRHLMQRLAEWGGTQGMRAMVGQVMADNQPMLGFMRALGFQMRRLPDEPEVMEARTALEPDGALERHPTP